MNDEPKLTPERKSDKPIEAHLVQRYSGPSRLAARCPTVVTMAAYDVYKEVFGEQEAIITGHCRGGFGAGELIAFLYARSFPRTEWRMRVDEAFQGMENL